MATTVTVMTKPEVAEQLESRQSLPPPVAHAKFNYWGPSDPPAMDDLSILISTSKDLVARTLPVRDLRSWLPLADYKHETHGLEILHQPLPIDPSPASVHDLTQLRDKYYPSIASLVKKAFGLRSAVVINHTMRGVTEQLGTGDPNDRKFRGQTDLAPFFVTHADYTAAGARAHFRAMTPAFFEKTQTEVGTTAEDRAEFFRLHAEITAAEDEAMRRAGVLSEGQPGDGDFATGRGGHWNWDGRGYEGPRYAMFTVWRPWEPVRRDPLAVLLNPLDELDTTCLPRMYKNRPGYVDVVYNENLIVRPPASSSSGEGESGDDKQHKWWFLSDQTPEELLAVKLYDSEALKTGDGNIKLACPHSSFHTEDMDDAPARRSCELRVWCIW
ncbi:GA4 desaturase [Xylariales sp. PMI_506]|nr:GA4 desaturase [Xylariales sp. PMI_506]